MNNTRRFIALLLAILLLLAAFPAASLAESYKIQTLNLNQWYKLQGNPTEIYKLKVTGDTIVSFSCKGIKADTWAGIGIYRDKSCNDSIDSCGIDEAASGSGAFVLYSGTYYIYMYDEKEVGKVKFSTRKTAAVNKDNYCLGKAISLKAGKKAEIAQTKKNNYHRWYRIKLAKTQSITFSGMSQYNFTLYDRNLNRLSCSDQGDVCVTQGRQPKGTYYLEIDRADLSDLMQRGRYTAFSWK